LKSIHQLSWEQFTALRSWDSRMNAWYVGISNRTHRGATVIYEAIEAAG